MLVLAIETATVNCSVALLHLDRLLAEECVAVPRVHSVLLMPMVAQLYQRVNAIPSETGLIAVSAGPGSFTGLRIGIATAKGLAYSWAKPCVAVGTLDAIAFQVLRAVAISHGPDAAPTPLACTVLKSRQGELYYGLFGWTGGWVNPVCQMSAADPRGIADVVVGAGADRLVVAGDVDSAECGQLMDELTKRGVWLSVAPQWLCRPSAVTVGVLGTMLWRRGYATDAMGLNAAYVRRSEAEIKWERMQSRR